MGEIVRLSVMLLTFGPEDNFARKNKLLRLHGPDFKIYLFGILTSNPTTWLKPNLCLFLSSKNCLQAPCSHIYVAIANRSCACARNENFNQLWLPQLELNILHSALSAGALGSQTTLNIRLEDIVMGHQGILVLISYVQQFRKWPYFPNIEPLYVISWQKLVFRI